MARVVDNRYAILELLGRGGAGEVFLARDEVLGRRVALKVLSRLYARDEEFVERFRREARSAAALNHPNIVAVHDLLEEVGEDGALCIVMEYVRGLTLADLIEREGALSWQDAAAVALHTARGLGAAHRRGVVHRDVKPANILLAQTPEWAGGTVGSDGMLADGIIAGRVVVKVTDFGVALDGSTRSLTGEGEIMGTVQYMSPEVVMGEIADPRSDLYSLGVVLYEMLLGRRPFEVAEAESPLAVAMRHVTETPVPPSEENPEVPRDLSAAITRLLGKDPADRHENAGALADELEALLRDRPEQRGAKKVAPVPERPPAGKNDAARPETRRFRKEAERRRLVRRRRALIGVSSVVLAVAVLAPAGLVGADRLSDGGVSRVLGVQVPSGASANQRVQNEGPTAEVAAGSASREFVGRVWGYTGDDEEEYWSRVEPLISEGFRNSPAWADVESGAELARLGGPAVMDSLVASEFLRFEVLEEGDSSVTGVAYFVNEKYPDGQRLDYRQELGFEKLEGRWLLSRGERMEPVKGSAAGEEVVTAVEDYYEALDRGDWSYAYDNLDSRARGLLTEDEWRRRSQWLADNGSRDMISIAVKATLTSGNLAAVKTDQTFADGSLVTRKTFFVYEGGAWKHRLSQEEVDIFMPGATYEEFVAFHARYGG